MEHKTLRLPAFLKDSLSNACWEHDMMFITELSRLIDVPIVELRKTLLMEESKQTVCIATEEKETFLDDIQCPAMLKQEDGSYTRCGNYRMCFEKKCSVHKTCVSNANLKWISDTMFNDGTYVKNVKDGETNYTLKSV